MPHECMLPIAAGLPTTSCLARELVHAGTMILVRGRTMPVVGDRDRWHEEDEEPDIMGGG